MSDRNFISKCPFSQVEGEIVAFDMLDERARKNPHPFYAWLQEEESRRIYKVPHEQNFYAIHRYDDVKEVLLNPKTFSNEMLTTAKSPFFALMDGQNHMRIRKVATKLFNFERPGFPLQEISSHIQSFTDELIDNRTSELFENWADAIPISTLLLIFGLPPNKAKIQKFHNLSIVINKALFVVGGTGERRSPKPSAIEKGKIAFSLARNTVKILRLRKLVGNDGFKELVQMFKPIKKEGEIPRPNFTYMPQALDALLTLMLEFAETIKSNKSTTPKLLNAAIDNSEISMAEGVMLLTFVLFAGYETSASLLSNSFVHLAHNTELQARLRENSDEVEGFIEEMIRFYTPVGRFLRKTTCDVKVAETLIPKGAIVILMLGSANTDADKFESSYEFDHLRKGPKNLSFGKGLHFCIGAPLARLQANAAIKHLLLNTSQLLLDDSKELIMVTDRDNGILRYKKLWVKIKAK